MSAVQTVPGPSLEMVDLEPVTDEKLEAASDQLSQLAKTWRKRRANPGVEPDA